ncbi:MAG: Uma2 family endonuclease [Blastocatellia bacterium]
MLDYVVQLTKDATQITPADHRCLRDVGFDDKGILQITLIASWFNYINRVADALGVGRVKSERGSTSVRAPPRCKITPSHKGADMSALPKQLYSIPEYIELLKNSDERFEYFDGEIVSMSGGTAAHSRIIWSITSKLDRLLEDSSCEGFNSEMAIKVPTALPFRFADVSVACGDPLIENFSGIEMLVNPRLIIEVLSPSTAADDHGAKFSAYQSIPGFIEYLLVAQDRPHITQYVRQTRGGWLRTETMGIEATLHLFSLEKEIPLRDIYRHVHFPPPDNPLRGINE